jgi:hypothetical protein
MNKIIALLLVSSIFTASGYYGSTTAPVTLAGGIIKSKSVVEITKKYKRKDCPVCKGVGWYMSGDKIKKIECTYCEADKGSGSISVGEIISINPIIQSPKIINSCPNNQCPPKSILRR